MRVDILSVQQIDYELRCAVICYEGYLQVSADHSILCLCVLGIVHLLSAAVVCSHVSDFGLIKCNLQPFHHMLSALICLNWCKATLSVPLQTCLLRFPTCRPTHALDICVLPYLPPSLPCPPIPHHIAHAPASLVRSTK